MGSFLKNMAKFAPSLLLSCEASERQWSRVGIPGGCLRNPPPSPRENRDELLFLSPLCSPPTPANSADDPRNPSPGQGTGMGSRMIFLLVLPGCTSEWNSSRPEYLGH